MKRKPSYEELEKELEILKRNANPQSLLSFSGILFVEINPSGIVTLVNNKTCEVLGYEEKEIVGKNWFENFIPKQTKKELLSISKKLLLGEIEAVEHYENPILTKKGEERIINWHNTSIKDENGNITGHLSLGDDITEQKKTEADLIKLNIAVNNSLNEVYVFDAATLKFSYVNQGVIKNLGYTFEELKTMSPLDIKPEYTLESFLTAIAPLRTGKVNKLQFQTIHQRKDNTTYPVEVNLSKFTIDKTSHFLALISDISERKHTENEIQDAKEKSEKSEQQLKEAQQISHLGHWELDMIHNKLIWSDEVYRILNLDPKKVKASEDLFMKLVHPDDRDGLNKAYLNAFKNKKPYQIKYRLLFKSGKIKHILGKGYTGYSDKGEPIFSIGTILDITSQIKIEGELINAIEKAEKNKEKFKQLSNLTFEGILIHDNGIVVDINYSFSKMIGYSPEELIGKNIIEFFVPKKYHQIISKSIAKNYVLPFEIEGIKKDGTIFPIEIEARNFISENNKTRRVAAIRDITQRKKAEAENKKLSTIVEQSANCVIITDVQGNIEYVNSQFTKRTGYTKKEVLGKNPRFLSSGKHSKEDFVRLWSTMLAGKTFKGEFLNKAKNGSYYWEHQTNTPIKNESGEITNFLSIREDISSLKESELRLKTLVESSPNPIFFKDGEGRWIEANKAGLEMFDLQDVDYHGKTDRDLIAYSKFYKDALLECERTDEIAWKQKKATKSEKNVLESTGINKVLDLTKVPLFHHDNTRKGIITITNDITHLKKIEQDLLTQNKELKQISDELSEKNRLLFDSQSKYKNLFEQSPVSLWEEDFYEVKQLLNSKIAETDDLKIYLDENPDFVNECASKIKIINVNEITLKLLGIENKDELVNHLSSNFNEKSFVIFKKELLAIALNKKEFSGETEFYRTDGKIIAALIKLVIIDDNEKAIVSIVDISALKQAENELLNAKEKAEESEKKFRELYEKSGDAILIIKNEIFIDCNQATVDLLGYNTKEEFLNSHPSTLSPIFQPDGIASRKKAEEMMRISLKNGTHRFEWIHTKSNGELFPVEVLLTAISNEPNNKIIHCVWRDITNRKKIEQELQESEELNRSITQSAGDSIISINSDGIILSWNNASEKIFGYEASEMINNNLEKIMGFQQRIGHNLGLKQLKNEDKNKSISKAIETTGVRKDGTEFPIDLTVSSWVAGNQKYYTGIIRDITERKKSEYELLNAKEKAEESDRLKTEFIQNMSHEIRTPMNGILGFSELLDNPELSSEKRKRFIEIIKNSTHQLLQIIDDIMEISVLEAKQIKAVENPVCLNDLLLELFSIFDIKAKEKKIPLYFKKGLSDEQSTILTDRTKLNKIVSNLLENALKFTNNGFVELGYSLKTDSKPIELEIYLKDTGIGLKPENQEIIFERFQQAEKDLSKKVGGLGLGLSIAKENTELLGGKLSVKSTYGEGTVFFVTIPYKPVNLVHKIAKEKEKKSGDKEKYTILIAEDEEVNFMVLEILLEDKIKLPCTIIHAKDGMEAVAFCKNNPTIELVLMDIKMPKMDGHEATRLIKEFRPDLPIIAQSAYSTSEEKEKAFLAGCDFFISKPISKDILNLVITKYLLADKTTNPL